MDSMSTSIINNLVNDGIIGFDIATSVMDHTPVIDNTLLPPDLKLKPQPEEDEFQPKKESLSVIQNPLWKKLLLGALAVTGLAFGAYKMRTSLIPMIKKVFKVSK